MNRALLRKTIFSLHFLVLSSLLWPFLLLSAQVKPEADSGKKIEYTSQYLRDPFQSPGEIEEERRKKGRDKPIVPPTLPSLQVQGMVWNSKMPQTIINNQVLTIGDIIEGVEILDIRREGVYVLFGESQYILTPFISK